MSSKLLSQSRPEIPKALGKLNIWVEILKHIEPNLEFDSETETQEKRKVALRVALLCVGLTELGLDTLWKSMTTLEPIVLTLNSFASPWNLNKLMTYQAVAPEPGCWVGAIGIARSWS